MSRARKLVTALVTVGCITIIVIIATNITTDITKNEKETSYSEEQSGLDRFEPLQATEMSTEVGRESFVDYLKGNVADIREEDTTEWKEIPEDNSKYDRTYTYDELEDVSEVKFSNSVVEQSMSIESDTLLILNIVKRECELMGENTEDVVVVTGEKSTEKGYYKVYLEGKNYKWELKIGDVNALVSVKEK